ncbi:MAG TPA: hypothetical protein VLA66_04415 [Thermoanaerobaculia bacterium]|nr:hypothetical protein [Thermoanaerobaculia bacterium]
MRDSGSSPLSSTRAVWALAAVALALLVFLRSERFPFSALRGDEGTYVAMAASLARDFDLEFGAEDRAWAEGHAGGPVSVILQLEDGRIAYSKPILYPLVAAPWYAVGGDVGLVALNLALLGLALWLAAAFLARLGPRVRATETVLTFLFAGGVAPYLGWRMAEALQVALATAGLALALAWARPAGEAAAAGRAARWLDAPAAPWIGALLLGLRVGLREPHALVAAVPVAAAFWLGRPRRALGLAAAILAAYLVTLGATWALTGAPNAYKANRATFTAATGYPAGAGSEAAVERFHTDAGWATSMLSVEPDWQPRLTAYSTLYFFVGRHSGLVASLPALLVLLAAALRRPDRVTLVALGGFAGLAAFFLVWWPSNYFGGETFVGNRYILAAAPCLLLGLGRLPSRRTLLAAWGLAAVAGASAAVSVARAGELDPTSQSHAHAGIFRLLPYESTASNIDGRRDRYWSDDFVRFVDPWAEVGPWSFRLEAGRPAAELELGTAWPGGTTTWLVAADAPGATLVVGDWRRTRRYPLAPAGRGSGGPVRVELAPAWRIHPFWWSDGVPARARLVRFRIEPDPEHPETRATVRYLGRRALPSVFAREIEAADALPEAVPFEARTTTLRFRMRNTGDWTWRSDDALPVQVGVRVLPFADGGGAAAREARIPLPGPVAPGESVELEVPIAWPEEAGRVRVIVDLVLEDVAWFADRVGTPLADAEVTLEPAAFPFVALDDRSAE